MAQFDLNRSNDTPIATLKLNEITPENWHRFPPPIDDSDPIYIPTVTYTGGEGGDDVSSASANSTTPYEPRTQAAKAGLLGVGMAVDVTTPRGWIDPREPYEAAPAGPTLTALDPAQLVIGSGSAEVTLTGTGFSPYTMVSVDGEIVPCAYVSATSITINVTPPDAVGTVDVRVIDHGVTSGAQPLEFVDAP